MKAAVYCRVSTDEQRDRQTIDTQVDFATRYAALHGIEIVEFYQDNGVSGGIPCDKRPEGARMLSDARAGKFEVLILYRVNRLSRSLLDVLRIVERLEEYNIALRSLLESFDSGTPMGKCMLQMVGSFGELEKATTLENSVNASKRRARDGQWLGGLAPLGYKIEDKRLVVDPLEAELVHRIFTMSAEGTMSLGTIADLLNAEGVPIRNEARGKGRGGRGWHPATLSKILHNTTYLGQNLYNKRKTIRKGGEVVGQEATNPGEQIVRVAPSIIDPETFEAARRALSANGGIPANAKRNYLLRGLIKCGECGRTYSGCSPSDRLVFYYKCAGYMTARGPQRCGAAIVRGDQLEADVWADIVSFAENPGKVMQKLRAQVQAQKNELAPLHVEQSIINQGVEAKQQERQRVIGLVRRALINDAEAEAELTTPEGDTGLRRAQGGAGWPHGEGPGVESTS